MTLQALKQLPPKSEKVAVEEPLLLLDLAGVPFQGSMDLVHVDTTVEVFDYKFWATPKTVPEPTIQTWGYLEEVRRRFLSHRQFSFTFLVVGKKSPHKVVPSRFQFGAKEIEERWQGFGTIVEDMKVAASKETAEQVGCNPGSCFKFGPCPYMSICKKNSQQEEIIMGFLDTLKELKDAKAAVSLPDVAGVLPPDAPPQEKPTAPEVAPVPTTVEGEVVRRGRKPGSKNKPKEEDPRPEDNQPEVDDYMRPPKSRPSPPSPNPSKVKVTFGTVTALERHLGPAFKYNNVTVQIEFEHEGTAEEALDRAQSVVEARIAAVVEKARNEVKK
jgi:hypothetical protein